MIKSVYIHIPFCKNICSYCDFCKVFYNEKWINDYLDSLEYEIKNNYKNEIIDTIYIGGGTPSSLSIDELNKLFNIIKNIKLNKKYEFTIECNIDDINKEKLELFKKNNINRISIGIESFNDKFLKYLNRNYKSDIIFEKINLVKKYFDNINVDLIYALKDQTLDDLKDDLDKIIKLDVKHVSCYSLMIQENTKLYIDKEKNINEDKDYEMYELINNTFKGIYNKYEISNYCKNGYESKHNLTYWNNEEYYGFGLGASGYIGNIRYTNTKNLSKYLNKNYDRQEEMLTKDDKIKYEFILGFRKKKGINKEEFYNKYNIDISKLDGVVNLLNKKYLIEDNENIYIDDKYIYVSNDILLNFL